jgi:hypothetical protein
MWSEQSETARREGRLFLQGYAAPSRPTIMDLWMKIGKKNCAVWA